MAVQPTADSQHLTTPDMIAIDGASAWSMSGWLYATEEGVSQFVYFGTGTGGELMQLFFSQTASIYRTRWDTVDDGANLVDIPKANLSLNTWHNYICTFDNTNLRVYLDAVEATWDVTNPSPDPGTGGLKDIETFIFGNLAADNQYFYGQLAEWAMWSRVLNAGERAMLQIMPPSRLAPDQLYLPMWDKDSGDLSPLGHNITVTGALSAVDHVPLGPPFGFDSSISYAIVAGGVAPTGSLYGPLWGPLAGVA